MQPDRGDHSPKSVNPTQYLEVTLGTLNTANATKVWQVISSRRKIDFETFTLTCVDPYISWQPG